MDKHNIALKQIYIITISINPYTCFFVEKLSCNLQTLHNYIFWLKVDLPVFATNIDTDRDTGGWNLSQWLLAQVETALSSKVEGLTRSRGESPSSNADWTFVFWYSMHSCHSVICLHHKSNSCSISMSKITEPYLQPQFSVYLRRFSDCSTKIIYQR